MTTFYQRDSNSQQVIAHVAEDCRGNNYLHDFHSLINHSGLLCLKSHALLWSLVHCFGEQPAPLFKNMELLLFKASDTTTIRSATDERRLILRPDEIKKSVFWLHRPVADLTKAKTGVEEYHDSAPLDMSAPVEGLVTRKHLKGNISTGEKIFAWGGMQLASNSKAIEIYYTEPQPLAKEKYLTTVKGLPTPEMEGLFKALCAVPGGPRAVVSVRLKFHYLQPQGTTCFRLSTFKLTARIPPENQTKPDFRTLLPTSAFPSMSSMFAGSGTGSHSHDHEHGSGAPSASSGESSIPTKEQTNLGVTKEDVGAAVAGMSFALRSTEDRITVNLQKAIEKNQMLQNQVHILTQQISQQTQILQYQSVFMQQQQALILEQASSLQSLKETLREQMVEILSEIRETRPVLKSATLTPNDVKKTPMAESGDVHTVNPDEDAREEATAAVWHYYASLEL